MQNACHQLLITQGVSLSAFSLFCCRDKNVIQSRTFGWQSDYLGLGNTLRREPETRIFILLHLLTRVFLAECWRRQFIYPNMQVLVKWHHLANIRILNHSKRKKKLKTEIHVLFRDQGFSFVRRSLNDKLFSINIFLCHQVPRVFKYYKRCVVFEEPVLTHLISHIYIKDLI